MVQIVPIHSEAIGTDYVVEGRKLCKRFGHIVVVMRGGFDCVLLFCGV